MAPAPAPRSSPFLFGYYGPVPVAAVAPSINMVWVWDTFDHKAAIQQMQDAKAHGVGLVVLDVSSDLFTYPNHRYKGAGELVAFKARLAALNLSQMVVALVPIDEPDVNGIDDATMTQAIGDALRAWAEPIKVAVIYGTVGTTPGIAAADWVSRDDYWAGTAVTAELPPIRPDQNYFLVDGGADPYRQPAQPFYDVAFPDPRYVGMVAFLYDSYTFAGHQYQGIGTNGELAEYTKTGCEVTGKCQ